MAIAATYFSWNYDGASTLTLTYTNFPEDVAVYQFGASDDLSDTPQFGTISKGSSGTLVASGVGFDPESGRGPNFTGILVNNDGSGSYTQQAFVYGVIFQSPPAPAPIPTPEDDTTWYDADRFVDPRDAPGEYFRAGAFDAQHGVRIPKTVDPLYQKYYNEGFAFGAYLDGQANKSNM